MRATTLESCVEALLAIQNCPVLYSLKFKHLVENLMNMKRSECAAVLLQYLDESERDAFGKVGSNENSILCLLYKIYYRLL